MLLSVGIVTALLGYTALAWGVGMADGHPASFAYLLGVSATNNAPGGAAGSGTSSAKPGGVLGDVISFIWDTSAAKALGL